eukprot:scaffold30167_cov53-Phaeocystis_antarctica.AAC.1
MVEKTLAMRDRRRAINDMVRYRVIANLRTIVLGRLWGWQARCLQALLSCEVVTTPRPARRRRLLGILYGLDDNP